MILLHFELTGSRKASHMQQLANFAAALSTRAGIPRAPPRDWPEAFQTLSRYLEAFPSKVRQVVFFDELPWLAARRSRFLGAFEYFWNSWAKVTPFAGGQRSRAPPGQCRAKLISDAGLVRDHFFEALEVGHHWSLVDHSDLADDRRAVGEDA